MFLASMSLNRYEQILYDYVTAHPDEHRYWRDRVLELDHRSGRRESIVLELNSELWGYFEERSRHLNAFNTAVDPHGGRISMLNLAEYLLATWPPPKPKKNRKSH